MLQPLATTTILWPTTPGDVADLQAIIADQTATLAAQAEMIDDYQAVLAAAQAVPGVTQPLPANATGTFLQDQLSISGASGVVLPQSTVPGSVTLITPTVTQPGWPTGGLHLLNQLAGTVGGAGTYQTDGTFTSTIGPINVVIQQKLATPPSAWPPLTDATDLMAVVSAQTMMIRTQTSLLQQYQDLLNVSATPVPPPSP